MRLSSHNTRLFHALSFCPISSFIFVLFTVRSLESGYAYVWGWWRGGLECAVMCPPHPHSVMQMEQDCRRVVTTGGAFFCVPMDHIRPVLLYKWKSMGSAMRYFCNLLAFWQWHDDLIFPLHKMETILPSCEVFEKYYMRLSALDSCPAPNTY